MPKADHASFVDYVNQTKITLQQIENDTALLDRILDALRMEIPNLSEWGRQQLREMLGEKFWLAVEDMQLPKRPKYVSPQS